MFIIRKKSYKHGSWIPNNRTYENVHARTEILESRDIYCRLLLELLMIILKNTIQKYFEFFSAKVFFCVPNR